MPVFWSSSLAQSLVTIRLIFRISSVMPIRPTVHKPSMQQTREQSRADFDRARAPARAKIYDHKWRKFSKSYRLSNPLCVVCLKDGIITVASEVHHIIDIRDAPDRQFDSTNLVSICHSCHSKITSRNNKHE